jgi:hypothetical protein
MIQVRISGSSKTKFLFEQGRRKVLVLGFSHPLDQAHLVLDLPAPH